MYSEVLKQYVVRQDAQVNKRRKSDKPKALSRNEFVSALEDFCTPGDLVGITPTNGCIVFNQYLKEHGKPMTGRSTFSRMVKETFGMRLKHIRTGYGTYAYVFVFDEEDDE